jgi:hypothetical protein
MPTRQLKVSFHKVVVTNADTPVKFGDILYKLHKVPNDRRRTMFTADEPVRLRYLKTSSGRWLGDLAKIRLHEKIDKSTVDGQEEEIGFRENEGPCEKTAFLYDPSINVIAIQQTAGSVSASSCGRYFKTLGQVRKIELQVMVKLEALERILRLGTIAKFQIRLAGIDSAKALRGASESSTTLMRFLRFLKAPTASISVGIDRETPTLERVAQLVRDALEWETEGIAQVKKLLVVGSEGDADEMAAIDLLRDRIIETVPVVLADGQRISDRDRYNAVKTAWERQRSELESQCGTP